MKRLFFFPVAPNPTKVRLYLAEKNAGGAAIDVEQVEVSLMNGEQNGDAFRVRNPMARLPVLELDDGSHVLESLVIIELLEELYPQPPMVGHDPYERARVRGIERIADLDVLISTARLVHSTKSPLGLPPAPQVAERATEARADGLRYLDSLLADGRPFLAGDAPTIADCTLAATLQFGRVFDVDIDPSLDNVVRWDRDYRVRDAVKDVLIR